MLATPQDTGITTDRICVEKVPDQKTLDDIHNSGHSHATIRHLRAAFVKTKLWNQNETITISFVSDATPSVPKTTTAALEKVSDSGKMDPLQKTVTPSTDIKKMIKKVVDERIQPLVNLNLLWIDDPEQAMVRIGFNKAEGSWSMVGTDCKKQKTGKTMNFGWFDIGTTIHEFGHMLGMIHEHQNPKGEEIEWNVPEVYKWANSTQGWDKKTTQTNILNKYKVDTINGSTFDPLSIMLYFFPGSLTTNDQGTHQNLRLSGLDTKWINKMYPTANKDEAAQFYEKVYSTTLAAAIAASKKLAKQGGGDGNKHTIIIVLCVIIGMVLIYSIGFFLYKFIRSKKSNRSRRRFS